MLLTIEAIQGTSSDDVVRARRAGRQDMAVSAVTPEPANTDPSSLDALLRAFRSSKPIPQAEHDEGEYG
jgi:hypothetical protein